MEYAKLKAHLNQLGQSNLSSGEGKFGQTGTTG